MNENEEETIKRAAEIERYAPVGEVEAQAAIEEEREEWEVEVKPSLTVGMLTELLKNYDPERIVDTEGCDCIGDADGVEDGYDGHVLITRKQAY